MPLRLYPASPSKASSSGSIKRHAHKLGYNSSNCGSGGPSFSHAEFIALAASPADIAIDFDGLDHVRRQRQPVVMHPVSDRTIGGINPDGGP
jgi:hypothetical protein